MQEKSLKQQRKKRPEIGAIWKKVSKQSNSEYMTMKLRLNKQKLLQLLDQCEEGEELEYNLVSFPNNGSEENEARPAFRIFEDLR